ncbi:MAG: type II toxin-antitoxin system HicB family antitoxin [Spirochaetia bacterium]|nr:type II toxin-antitoxin system HicB family antitoxin [Spirochaetia bacterium]
MKASIDIHIEKLPEGVYLATSPSLQGLIAQGRTIAETLEIARDVARKIIESKISKEEKLKDLKPVTDSFDYSLIVNY